MRQLDGDGNAEMKSLHPATLVGPGVAGTRTRAGRTLSSPESPFSPSPLALRPQQPHFTSAGHDTSQRHRATGSARRYTHDYGPVNHESMMSVPVDASVSYSGPPLPPPPTVLPMGSLTINPSAGRGRPKGKSKGKPVNGDEPLELDVSPRTSPRLTGPAQLGNPPPNALISIGRSMSVDTTVVDSSGPVELAPCKPRRGRPPRHEVVPGMGEFTVFL